MLKRYTAEFLGTFVIVFAPVALASTGKMNGGAGGLLAAAFISGLSVLAMICALGPISAAHFNPAVTLGFAVAKRFPWRYVPSYWLSQISGAIAAAAAAWLFFGQASGAHVPSDRGAIARNVGLEAMISFLLMIVIISVATDRRVSGAVPGLAIGFMVTIGVLIAGPVTGGSMNPARSLGPALFAGGEALSSYWIYVVGPCLGAAIAAVVFEAIRLEPEHAKGAPNELLEVLTEIAGRTHRS